MYIAICMGGSKDAILTDQAMYMYVKALSIIYLYTSFQFKQYFIMHQNNYTKELDYIQGLYMAVHKKQVLIVYNYV